MEYTIKNPRFREVIKEKLKGQHFMHLMGFDLSSIEAGRVTGQMPLEQKHLQQFGFVHGGVTSTVCDITMGFAAYSLMPEGQGVVTANLSVDYLRPGMGSQIKAEATVEKAGSKLIYCSAKVYTMENGQWELIATGRSIMAVVDKR